MRYIVHRYTDQLRCRNIVQFVFLHVGHECGYIQSMIFRLNIFRCHYTVTAQYGAYFKLSTPMASSSFFGLHP